VRAIAKVAQAVVYGDFTRFISLEALGELGMLIRTINKMIANLKETTLQNKLAERLPRLPAGQRANSCQTCRMK
jgi:osomolarity two-component system sensor histidine kinase NIK1